MCNFRFRFRCSTGAAQVQVHRCRYGSECKRCRADAVAFREFRSGACRDAGVQRSRGTKYKGAGVQRGCRQGAAGSVIVQVTVQVTVQVQVQV